MTKSMTTLMTACLEVRRTISPYHLTAAENPRVVSSHPLLRRSNYNEWPCGIKTALISRIFFGFLDGTIPKPAEASSDYEDWLTVNDFLVSWIKMTIDLSIKSNISHCDVTKDLRVHILHKHAVTSGPRNQQIKLESLSGLRYHNLLNMNLPSATETITGKLSKPSWILDMDSSHHMIGKLESFFWAS